MGSKLDWSHQVKIWEEYYLKNTPIDKIRKEWEAGRDGIAPSWDTIRGVTEDFLRLTQAQVRQLPELLQERWREVRAEIDVEKSGQTDVAQHAGVGKEETPKAASGSELADICQTEFARIRLPTLLRPFLSQSGHPVESPFEKQIRYHSGHSAEVAEISSSIRNTAEFSRLKARFPDHKIWSGFSEWEKQSDSYVDAFRNWFTNQWNSVERVVLTSYGEAPRSDSDFLTAFDKVIAFNEAAKMINQNPLEALSRGFKVVTRDDAQRFGTISLACAMLRSGIAMLPSDQFWADELDELARIKAAADSRLSFVPEDFIKSLNSAKNQRDETKKLVELADKLRKAEATMIGSLQKLASLR